MGQLGFFDADKRLQACQRVAIRSKPSIISCPWESFRAEIEAVVLTPFRTVETLRREFITLLGGTVVAWPLAARAQQVERMPRIGVLMVLNEDNPETKARIAKFRQGL